MAFWKKGDEDLFSGTSMAVVGPRCYESHPVLKIGKGKLYGGNGRHPVIDTADVYVALQSGDMMGRSTDPWEKKQKQVEIACFITDGAAPDLKDIPRFKKVVTYVCNQLQAGKTVHVGCIGGHGRTGTVLAAVVAEALGEKDAIGYVRKHYCKKAVESREQVDFLVKHYGVKKVDQSRASMVLTGGKGGRDSKFNPMGFYYPDGHPNGDVPPLGLPPVRSKAKGETALVEKATKSYPPVQSSRSLYRKVQ